MQYKVTVNGPDNEDLINRLIDAASAAGAGVIGNYSRVAFVTPGFETWNVGDGAHPHDGTAVGTTRVQPSVRIEMRCNEATLAAVEQSLRQAHPYEEPVIEVTPLHPLPSTTE